MTNNNSKIMSKASMEKCHTRTMATEQVMTEDSVQ